MNINFEEIIKYLLSISTILGALIYLSKISINYFINKGFEKYKIGLNKEVEEFKSELKLNEIKSQISFNKLHEERAFAIKKLYELSLNLFDSIFELTQPSQGFDWVDKNYGDKMFSNLKKFQQNYVASKIFLERNICIKIDELVENCFNLHSEMDMAKQLGKSEDRWAKSESTKIWSRSFQFYLKELHEINNELIDHYRKILGVE